MKTTTARYPKRLILLAAILVFMPGCQNENEEFMNSGVIGPKPDHPNETYTERRSRTFRPSKAQAKAGGNAQAPAKP